MKCMIIRKADADTEAGKMPESKLLEAMGRYNERLVNAGVFVDGTGLKPSDKGLRININHGDPIVTDGPFTEVKELIAGFTMIETDTFEEAVEWARQWPAEDGDVELELRPVYGLEDFAPSEGLDVHHKLDARLASQPAAISSYLSFGNGKCREAFEFYAAVLGGELIEAISWKDMGMQDSIPAERLDQLAHGTVKFGRYSISGVDNAPDEVKGSPGTMLLTFDTPEQTSAACAALSEGGSVRLAPRATEWSSCFAMLSDRYGVDWLLNCSQPPAAGGA